MTDIETEVQSEMKRDRKRHIERQIERQRDRERQRDTERQRNTERQRDTETQKETEKDRERQKETGKAQRDIEITFSTRYFIQPKALQQSNQLIFKTFFECPSTWFCPAESRECRKQIARETEIARETKRD